MSQVSTYVGCIQKHQVILWQRSSVRQSYIFIPRKTNFILGSFSVVDVDILMFHNMFVLSVIW